MKATEHPKAPCNQPFQLNPEKKISKNSRWNPSSPNFWEKHLTKK